METGTTLSVRDYKVNVLQSVRQKYPNAISVVCAAFGISHSYYEDDTMNKRVAETRYTNIPDEGSFVGVKLIFIWL